MLEDKPEDVRSVKRRFDKISKIFDYSEKTFEAKLEWEMEWEGLLKSYLPKDKGAKILDAGGGTGRMTLPLAKLGYHVTLSDLSPGMLAVAREKLERNELLDRVEIKEADISSLPFHDESFDLVVCLHGAFRTIDAAKELARVVKRGGKIIVDALSRYGASVYELNNNPETTLKLLKSEVNHAYDFHRDWMRVFSPEELKGLFEKNNIKVIGIYGSFYPLLSREILEKQRWDDKFLNQVVAIMTYLRDTPSVIGMAGELLLVGEKI